MMIGYIVMCCVMLLCMNVLQMRAWETKKTMVKATGYLTAAINVTVLSSMMAAFFPVKEAALFMQCVQYASMEWLLIFLLRFMEEYTSKMFAKKWTKVIFYILTVVNNISLLLNCVFHHVVTNQYVDIGNGVMCFAYRNLAPWYQLHFYYCCIIILCNLVVLANTAVRVTSLYRRKYVVPLVVLVLTVVSERVCNIMEYALDYSLLVYIVLVMFLTYYSIFYAPKGLITETLAYVVQDSRSGVVCFDINGKCIYANEVAMNIYGNPSELSAMEAIFQKEAGNAEFADMEERTWNTVFPIDEHKLYYQISFTKLYDKKHNYIGCFFLMYDKTEDVERYMEERYRATHDSLTHLFNREHFSERVMGLLTAYPDRKYYMGCMNIKDFKLINDLFGFDKGNEILIHLAKQMQAALPEETVCGRMESDHFAFFTPRDSFSEDMITSCVNQVIGLMKDCEYQIYIHAGIYAIQPEDNDVSVMCDRANMAIATIKNSYDCIIAHYDTKHMERMMREKYLVGEFDLALEEEQFLMFLQPQVDRNGTVLGGEALVRWRHPEKGMIPPGEFIEVFEKTGLIHRLDEYIWNLAAKKLSEWKKRGQEHLHISVNISVKDFYYLDVYKIFTELVQKYDISPEKLKLEITETALMLEQDKMLVLLEKLQRYGFCVEIDDFGSGYSSLNMLKDIHADVLKIDMGFLRETQNDERAKIILGMVVDLAKQLHMTVVTEGVENKEQVEYLREVGCDMFQGYYFDRPIDVSDFEAKYINYLSEIQNSIEIE